VSPAETPLTRVAPPVVDGVPRTEQQQSAQHERGGGQRRAFRRPQAHATQASAAALELPRKRCDGDRADRDACSRRPARQVHEARPQQHRHEQLERDEGKHPRSADLPRQGGLFHRHLRYARNQEHKRASP